MSRTCNRTLLESLRTVEPSTSERHRLLAAERRRLVLDVLEGETAPVELDDLAVKVATRESEMDAANEGDVERVAMTLHHVHLPKMVNTGVLDYDPETNLIDPAELGG